MEEQFLEATCSGKNAMLWKGFSKQMKTRVNPDQKPRSVQLDVEGETGQLQSLILCTAILSYDWKLAAKLI
jgi:hypothetical protein